MDKEDQSPMTFPCQFPIKAMGLASNELEQIIFELVQKHVPDLGQEALKQRASGNGKYLSITVTVEATSREQLDAIYYDLTACEHVIMAL